MRSWFPVVLSLCLLASVAHASDMSARGKILRIESRPAGVSLLIKATHSNPEGLGKFQANVTQLTKLSRLLLCQPPQPAKIGDLRVGQHVAVTFPVVLESNPLQVNATTLTILDFPHDIGVGLRPTAQVKGTIKNVALAKTIPSHAGTGFIVLAGNPDDLMGYPRLIIRVTQTTKIFVPGPACGAMEVGLQALQPGWTATAQIRLPLAKSLPPQATGNKIYAGFR